MSHQVIIVGAGMTGLVAGRALQTAGQRVLLLDKGRGTGGRMATRRMGRAVCDHGAQFITVREPAFGRLIDQWHAAGAVEEWCRGFAGEQDGHSRFRGHPAMTAVPKLLARDLPVQLEQKVATIFIEHGRWVVATEQQAAFLGNALILTAPVPQSLALLAAGGVTLAAESRDVLAAIDYDPCLAVLAVLAGPSAVPAPGAKPFDNGPVAWIADNQAKGISPVPCVTIHASPRFSREHWEGDRTAAGEKLLEHARPWLGSAVTEFQVHGWRYSQPLTVHAARCLVAQRTPPLVFAGDAFGGPRVEGAALSGLAAAETLLTVS